MITISLQPKQLIWLILIHIGSMFIFFSLFFLDNENMLNNGYINKDSVSFTLHEPHTKTKKLNKDQPYLLFQFHIQQPNIKYVYTSGDVQLPPINWVRKDLSIHSDKPIAIIGKDMDHRSVPPEYELGGFFETEYSYQLNKSIWLFSGDDRLEMSHGTTFIFSTPSAKPEYTLHKVLGTESVKILERTNYGTYVLHSNQMLLIGMKVGLLLLSVFFIAVSTHWIMQERSLIQILYLEGNSPHSIYCFLVKNKILPCIGLSVLSLSLVSLALLYITDLWSNRWLLYSIYLHAGLTFYIFLFLLITVRQYTFQKGGKKL